MSINTLQIEISMSNKNASLKSGIRDNLLRETVHDFLEQEIKNGSALSIVSAYFTIYAYEKRVKAILTRLSEITPEQYDSHQTMPMLIESVVKHGYTCENGKS